MFGSIKGKIILKTDKYIILELNSLGYKISLPSYTLNSTKLDEEIFLWLHTHVREDQLELYGFPEREEIDLFEKLITISGIGPKGAISIISTVSAKTLIKAINEEDKSYLTKISGIGKKTAEKIILELKDKIISTEKDSTLREELDALEALKSLGYSVFEGREALKQIDSKIPLNSKIKQALKILGGK